MSKKDDRERVSVLVRGFKERLKRLGKYPDLSWLVRLPFTTALHQIIDEWLLLKEREKGIIPPASDETGGITIAQILGAEDLIKISVETGISLERLEQLRQGARPEDEELLDLTEVLTYSTNELLEIRDRQRFNHQKRREKQTNGK